MRAAKSEARTTAIREELEAQIDYLIAHRDDILAGTRRELLSRYEDLRAKLRRAEGALSWSGPQADLPQAELSEVQRTLHADRKRQSPTRGPETSRVAVGDRVNVRGLGLDGTVATISEQTGEAEVSIGNVRLRMELSRLSRVDDAPSAEPAPVGLDLTPSLASAELDIRGLRGDEALIRLEWFMDKAVGEGFSTVRIIHGHGTGALRRAVRKHLENHPVARSFSPEVSERGGDGVTLIELN